MVFAVVTSFIKKQTLPDDGKKATSPLLNSDLDLSIPESILVSKYRMLWPRR